MQSSPNPYIWKENHDQLFMNIPNKYETVHDGKKNQTSTFLSVKNFNILASKCCI